MCDAVAKCKPWSVYSRSVIVVHGLGGKLYDTWTNRKTGTCWVKDLLPDKIPGTRVMAFGYNAKRINHRAEIEFLDLARLLLAGLSQKRGHPEVGFDEGHVKIDHHPVSCPPA
jgi:hypothetical protein